MLITGIRRCGVKQGPLLMLFQMLFLAITLKDERGNAIIRISAHIELDKYPKRKHTVAIFVGYTIWISTTTMLHFIIVITVASDSNRVDRFVRTLKKVAVASAIFIMRYRRLPKRGILKVNISGWTEVICFPNVIIICLSTYRKEWYTRISGVWMNISFLVKIVVIFFYFFKHKNLVAHR